MQTVSVEIPAELVRAAGWSFENLSSEAVPLLALDNVPLHYGIRDLEEDRRILERLGL
jgi:hypothetical protein